jgi:endoribonuclease L-PSP, putative
MKTGLKVLFFAGLLISVVSCNSNAPTETNTQEVRQKRVITAENARKSTAPLSQAIEIDGTLYISGQLGVDPATGALVEGGIKEQTEQVLKNIGTILSAAGYTYANVVKSTCFLSDIANFAEMNGVYAGFYSVDPPARSAFAVKDLPMKGALIEIETIAVR